MPNQKDIAKALGVTQATVSRALRGDRLISAAMRNKVAKTAKKMGYHQNAYLTILMSNIRKGKTLSEKGVIGLLIEAGSQKEWYENKAYQIFHRGLLDRADELGFRVDSFYLRKRGMSVSRIGAILHARGIMGIILAPPYHGNRALAIDWERHATIGVGFGWEDQELNRVAYDQLRNYLTAFNALREMGYRRIGTVLGSQFVSGNRHGYQWFTGYADCQYRIPAAERIPVFDHKRLPIEKKSPGQIELPVPARFEKWFTQWKPDALLTLAGYERLWLDTMKVKVPQDIGLACIGYAAIPDCAHIDAKGDIVGATALEQVTAQIARNEFGVPSSPRTTMIEGEWVHAPSVRNAHH